MKSPGRRASRSEGKRGKRVVMEEELGREELRLCGEGVEVKSGW